MGTCTDVSSVCKEGPRRETYLPPGEVSEGFYK